eukprot:NODE_423_length_2270_cov_31.464656_g389_i0.p2 GENE.NODE_423_length_2270_cov_31.464656_g389_i0~~NODE_423_length_2270_cov_31.464656_g389_i0.p2  ORF type:complete len:295 (+),score=57.77 NODE_423_length_2270_cov_31.464656_g389_i0:1219-2103(+)
MAILLVSLSLSLSHRGTPTVRTLRLRFVHYIRMKLEDVGHPLEIDITIPKKWYGYPLARAVDLFAQHYNKKYANEMPLCPEQLSVFKRSTDGSPDSVMTPIPASAFIEEVLYSGISLSLRPEHTNVRLGEVLPKAERGTLTAEEEDRGYQDLQGFLAQHIESVAEFCNMGTIATEEHWWEDSRRFLHAHPQLLTETGVLATRFVTAETAKGIQHQLMQPFCRQSILLNAIVDWGRTLAKGVSMLQVVDGFFAVLVKDKDKRDELNSIAQNYAYQIIDSFNRRPGGIGLKPSAVA